MNPEVRIGVLDPDFLPKLIGSREGIGARNISFLWLRNRGLTAEDVARYIDEGKLEKVVEKPKPVPAQEPVKEKEIEPEPEPEPEPEKEVTVVRVPVSMVAPTPIPPILQKRKRGRPKKNGQK